MDTEFVPPEEALGRCAWCGKAIPDDTPVFGLGAKRRPGVDLSAWQGHAVRIALVTQERIVIAMVAGADSDASKEGKDVMFLLCSEPCASETKSVLEQEAKIGNLLFGGFKRF
jgi:hypothetical protein